MLVDGGVDPATTLREQDAPRLGRSGLAVGIGNELVSHVGEVLGHQRSQETILTKRQQVLLVEGVDVAIAVLADNSVRNDQRLSAVSGA